MPEYIVYSPTNHNDIEKSFNTLEEAVAHILKGGTYGDVFMRVKILTFKQE